MNLFENHLTKAFQIASLSQSRAEGFVPHFHLLRSCCYLFAHPYFVCNNQNYINKVINLINVGIKEGATLATGGPDLPNGLNKGYFVKPTAFADVNNQMQIARTEIFGPVLSIIPFETEEEAITIANDTPYGLLNFIQTQDQEKANRVARKLRSGMVDVNGVGIAVASPFGGYKHSGIGREAGTEGLIEFLDVKTVGGWN